MSTTCQGSNKWVQTSKCSVCTWTRGLLQGFVGAINGARACNTAKCIFFVKYKELFQRHDYEKHHHHQGGTHRWDSQTWRLSTCPLEAGTLPACDVKMQWVRSNRAFKGKSTGAKGEAALRAWREGSVVHPGRAGKPAAKVGQGSHTVCCWDKAYGRLAPRT